MKYLLSSLLGLFLLASAPTYAQGPGPQPGGGVRQIGPVVPGNCTDWTGANQISDAGGPCGIGTGNVNGAASSIDGDIVQFSGTTGKLLKDTGLKTGTSGATIPLNNGGFTQSGTVNFTGPFQIGGVVESFPASGAIVGTTDTQTLTGKTISGLSNTLSNIGNGSLANSSITFGTTAVSLGSSVSGFNGVNIGATTPGTGAFTTLAVTGNLTTNITGSTQCVQANSLGVLSGTGALCGSGGGGAVNSVTGTAGQVTASPSTGAVIISLPSTITANETFSGTVNFSGVFQIGATTESFPASGNIVGTTDIQTLSNKTISGVSNTITGIGNSSLVNSSIIFGATPASLGSTVSAIDGVSLGATVPSSGAFTTLSASSTVSGAGFSNYLAAPPAIGGTTPNSASFTTLALSGNLTTNVTGSTQCLQVNSLGVVSGSGATCGGSGGAVNSVTGTAGQIAASPTTGAVVLSLPATITSNETFSGTVAFSGIFQIGLTTETFPASGSIAGTTDTQTFTNKTISGSSNTLSNIANASLVNSSITFGATAQALGSTVTNLNAVNIGPTTAGTGAFTTLSASSTVSGTGFSTYLASPPAIGGTTPSSGKFTTLTATGNLTTNVTGATQCLQVNSSGVVSGSGATCGSGTSNMTGSGSTTAGDLICSNNTGTTLTTAVDCGVVGIPVNEKTGSYSLNASENDAYSATVCNSASAMTITVGQAGTTGFEANKWFYIKNRNTGVCTVSVTTSSVFGSVTLTLNQNAGITLISYGGNYLGANDSVAMSSVFTLSSGAWTIASGGVTNAMLANSSITFGATPAALGTTVSALNSISVGATTASTGAFTTLSASSTVSGAGFTALFASPPAIGSTAAGTGAFTTLSASSTVSGTGFSTYLASPPAIGGTLAAAGTFTTLTATGNLTTNITGSTQCVQASSTGILSGTGSACGSGGSTAFSGLTGGTNTTAAMVVGSGATLKALSGTLGVNGSTSGTVSFAVPATAGTNTATLPANTGTVAELNLAQTWSAAQAFNSTDFVLNGSSSGTTTLNASATAGTTTATLPANTGTIAELNLSQSWTAGQAVTPTTGGTQSAGGTLTPDFSTSNSITATFGAGNLTIANPSNVKAGQGYTISLTQDATGGRTVTWGTNYKWAGGTAPTLSTGANAKDVISCWADTTTTINCTLAIKGAAWNILPGVELPTFAANDNELLKDVA